MRFETAASGGAARWTLGLVFAGLALTGGSAWAQDSHRYYQVIVNTSNPATELARAEVSRWFLKQANKWPDGKVVVPVDQSTRSEVRAFFCAGVHRQSTQAIDTYWQKQIFSGRTAPPFVKVGDAEVMAYVSGNVASIGYVTADATLSPGVKAIKIKD
jgi:ABC-type phosphate transport system substrate-binding protein